MSNELKQFCMTYLNTWIEAMNRQNGYMVDMWNGLHDWTTAHMQNVLYPVAQKLGYDKPGYNSQQEYYRVDFSLYTYIEQSVWTLDYAIEHENAEFVLNTDSSIKYKGWFDEFVKLFPLKCAKARIIIGYDSFFDSDAFYKKVQKCFEWLNKQEVQPSLTDSPIGLIIFPYTKYISQGDYKNGLLHIVWFDKRDGRWIMNNEVENHHCDEAINSQIEKIYAKIAKISK